MKKTVIAMLILMLLDLCVPGARAEISQDLDPMVPVDFQATETKEASASGATNGQTSNAVSVVDKTKEKKKTEETKKKKTKKSSTKKTCPGKSSKSTCKRFKASTNSSH